VSWNVANVNLSVTTAPKDTPWHSWVVVDCGRMSIGYKGMTYASKTMAMTMTDLFENQELVEKVKKEYEKRKGDEVYKAIIPEGPSPINEN
jgi:aminobenzoyl-glutamate utilization protein B